MPAKNFCSELEADAHAIAARVGAICTPDMMRLEMRLTGESEETVRDKVLQQVRSEARASQSRPSQQRGH